MRQVCLGVKGDGLVTRVVTRHVTLATVDAHVLQTTTQNFFYVLRSGTALRQL